MLRIFIHYHLSSFSNLSCLINFLNFSGCSLLWQILYTFEPNKGETLAEGTDLTIIASGMMIKPALDAAAALQADKGISVRVVNIHTIKPLDGDIVKKAAAETGAIVVAEEHNVIGGLGSAVAECVAETYPCPVLRVGVQDTFGRSGKVPPLLEMYGLTAEAIVEKAEAALAIKAAMGK